MKKEKQKIKGHKPNQIYLIITYIVAFFLQAIVVPSLKSNFFFL